MEKKENLVGVSDFAGFERNADLSLWRARTFQRKDDGSKVMGTTWVYILARWWMDAKDLAIPYFNSTEVEITEDVGQAVEPGKVFVCKDPTGGYQTLQATGEANRASILRGAGLRKWEPVALKGRREDEAPVDRVQADRKGVVQSQTARAAKDSARSAKGGKNASNGAGHRGAGLRGPAKNGLRGAAR